jgi:uncharacterized protein (TIGR02118 family)
MTRLVGLLKRAEGWDRERFRAYWVEHHAQVARDLPGLRRYRITIFDGGERGEEPRYDGMAELWFDDRAAFEAAFASPTYRASEADHPFVGERVILLSDEEHSIV